MREFVLSFIAREIEQSGAGAMFREPLVGFSSACDSLYMQLRQIIGEYVSLPRDVLPSAQTVISFFIPFSEAIANENRGGQWPARSWAECYLQCNALIDSISQKLTAHFEAQGMSAACIRATHTYNREKLESAWSHKSAAFIAGLGTFGLNRLLITRKGCAGRYGSVLISEKIESDTREDIARCIALAGGNCNACVQSCPAGALTAQGFDKFVCHDYLLTAGARFGMEKAPDVCGKCGAGPCAVLEK